MPISAETARDFEEYVRVSGPRLARAARLLVEDRATAEDLVQTVLAAALGSWHRVRAADDVDAYLRRALVNARSSWWRRRMRELAVAPRLHDVPVEDQWAGVELRHELLAALSRLPERQRAAVVFRYYEDLSETQVAHILGCSVGTVRSHTARGIRALRAALALRDQDGVPAHAGRR